MSLPDKSVVYGHVPNTGGQAVTSTTLAAATNYVIPFQYNKTVWFSMEIPILIDSLLTSGIKWDIDLGTITTETIIANGGLHELMDIDCLAGEDVALPTILSNSLVLRLSGIIEFKQGSTDAQLRIAKHANNAGDLAIGKSGSVKWSELY